MSITAQLNDRHCGLIEVQAYNEGRREGRNGRSTRFNLSLRGSAGLVGPWLKNLSQSAEVINLADDLDFYTKLLEVLFKHLLEIDSPSMACDRSYIPYL